MKLRNFIPLVVVLGFAGLVFASANTLGITPTSSKLGSGTTTVDAGCGTVATVAYVLNSTDAAALDKVTFTTAPAAACAAATAMVTVYAGATPLGTEPCIVTADSCTTAAFSSVDVSAVTKTAITITGP